MNREHHDTLQDTLAAGETIAGHYRTLTEGDDPDTLARTLTQIRQVRRTLADLERACERQLADCAPQRTFDIDGLGRIEIRRQLRRTGWDHDGLVTAVAKATAGQYGFDIGEIGDTLRVYRRCVSTGPAKTAFETLTGHSRDEFCEVEPNGVSVTVTETQSAPRLEGF